ncbi:MAG TPA: hypothetical protein VJR05_02695 [Acidimicrobiia bacterium]|nr:hypothetical protein [Acidimicrobiia bacterium]
MKWLLGLLGVATGALLVFLFFFAWPDGPGPSLPDEAANLGGDRAGFLPLGQPLLGSMFLTEGRGTDDDPYRLCLPSSKSDSPSCLFTVHLRGLPDTLAPQGWHDVTASFEVATPDSVQGVLIESRPPSLLRRPGPERLRGTRFVEADEILYNWAAAHGISGYLRRDAVYVWYLSPEASMAAQVAGVEQIVAAWRQP